ncbi:MAG: GspE/PulE family protein [Holosporales bacterium]
MVLQKVIGPQFDIIEDYVAKGLLRADQGRTIAQQAQFMRIDPEVVLQQTSFCFGHYPSSSLMQHHLAEHAPQNLWQPDAQHPMAPPTDFVRQELHLVQQDENFAKSFVLALLWDAVRERVSDIHLSPEDFFVRVRYRLDGVLSERFVFHQAFWSRILVCLKITANLDIAETRKPQSGRFEETIDGRIIDCRLSTMPTVDGENLVIRLLDRLNALIPLADLGYGADQRSLLQRMVSQQEGLIVVTGPTGSGKTTTLYALLQHLADESRNVMTLEDPVEYRLPLIRQSEVKEASGLGFAAGVRAILRQDPDVILISEIRDEATALAALRAALTGHLVLATVHANNAFGVIHRLLDLGLPAPYLASSLRGIISQRLLRRRQGRGYAGRVAIAEIINVSESLKLQIAHGASLVELRRTAMAEGFIPLHTRAENYIRDGITDVEEVRRVLPWFEEPAP